MPPLGVGLAAVQLAQRAGAEIFATAGTPEKRGYLESLGVQHGRILGRRFRADEVMQITGGKGVDVVLNPCRGDFAVKSLALLGACGRFIEIGKTDIYQNKQIWIASGSGTISLISRAIWSGYAASGRKWFGRSSSR